MCIHTNENRCGCRMRNNFTGGIKLGRLTFNDLRYRPIHSKKVVFLVLETEAFPDIKEIILAELRAELVGR